MTVLNESMKKPRSIGFVWMGMMNGKEDSPFKTIVSVLSDGKMCPIVALKTELTRITDAEITPIDVVSPYKVFSCDPNIIGKVWNNKPILFTGDAFNKFIESNQSEDVFERTIAFAHDLSKEIVNGKFWEKVSDYKDSFSEYFCA